MPIVLGLLSSVSYGTSDFLAGHVSRRTSPVAVATFSQAIGLVLMLAALPILSRTAVAREVLAWGAASGVLLAIGLVALYRGLARGRMSIVAPVAAVIGGTTPVLVGLGTGERLSTTALAGVIIALVALVLVTRRPGSPVPEAVPENPSWMTSMEVRGLPEAFLAGVAFGGFFVLFARAGESPGLWALLALRAGALGALILLTLATARRLRLDLSVAPTIVGIGLLELAGSLFFLLATRGGLLSIVAVLASLYPATTVALARVVLKERLTGGQAVGLGTAAVGVVLLSLG